MRTAIVFLLFLIPGIIPGQDFSDEIETIARSYYAMRAYENKVSKENMKMTDVDSLKQFMSNVSAEFERVSAQGSIDEKIAAYYFKTLFLNDLAFAYASMRKNPEAYDTFKSLEQNFEYFSLQSVYPFIYKYDSIHYEVTYKYFAPAIARYNAVMSELAAHFGKWDDVTKYSRKVIESSIATSFQKYISTNQLIEYKNVLKEKDQDLLDHYLKNIEFMKNLDDRQLEMIADRELPGYEDRCRSIRELVTFLGRPDDYGVFAGDVAVKFLWIKDSLRAMEYFAEAFAKGYSSQLYTEDAAYLAIKLNNRELASMAAKQLESEYYLEDNCHKLMTLSNINKFLGSSSRAKEYERRSDKCARKKSKNK
jgi:hypothetical protein